MNGALYDHKTLRDKFDKMIEEIQVDLNILGKINTDDNWLRNITIMDLRDRIEKLRKAYNGEDL